MVYIKLHCRLKDLRETYQLTQEELAEKLGVSRQSIISLEGGKSLPSVPLVLEISRLFEKTFEEIFGLGRVESKLDTRNIYQGGKMRGLVPWRPFGPFSRDFDRFFDEDWESDLLPRRVSVPAIDVYETDKEVVVKTQLPGVQPEEVEISVADDVLSIRGEKKTKKEEKDKNYYRREISYGSFSRSVHLPSKVKSDQTKAEFSDGILEIVLPKIKSKKAKTVKIKVKK